jgi:hypothetical protein
MDHSRWEDDEALKDFLSDQLFNGRLSMVLGAGISKGFGLPGWEELITRAISITHISIPQETSKEDAADLIFKNICHGNEIEFAKLIHEALYQGVDLSFKTLHTKDLLTSIAAITTASRRGSISRVITFNFDDLLELYLSYLGFSIESVAIMPTWDSKADIHIYHRHGILPNKSKDEVKSGIVFAQSHYNRSEDKSGNIWRQALLNILRSHTCLLIGLSGEDSNLLYLLAEVKDSHSSKDYGHPYFGVCFSAKEEKRTLWGNTGIYQKTIADYNQISNWLFEICQRASGQLQPRIV